MEIVVIIGVLALVGGMLIYRNYTKKEGDVGGKEELKTNAKEKKKPVSKTKVQPKVEGNDKERKGNSFEKFIVRKFNRRHFRINEWATDKDVDTPTIQLTFTYNQESTDFSIQCNWTSNLIKEGVNVGSNELLEKYREFEKKKDSSVFIVFGVGGKPKMPEQLFVVPLKEISTNFIHIDDLKKYEKIAKSNFFFDLKTKELK